MKNSVGFWRISSLLLAVVFLLTAASQPALAQDEPAGEPTIVKDSIFVEVSTLTFDLRGSLPKWSPTIKFRVTEPTKGATKGSRIWVEVSYPGKKNWLTDDCDFKSEFAGTSAWECLGPNDEAAIRFTGLVDFVIHISNELYGTNKVLFQGKAKVAKKPPEFKNNPNFFNYYVDEDWRIPIGYLSRGRTLNFEVWFRGHWVGATAYMFYQGKKVADGINCVGAPVRCEFFAGDDSIQELKPGEYEIKVLKDERLVRTAKFTVAEDGSYDNGIATANKLGSNKVIIPVSVVGVQEGPWDKLAWKTGAFYGNPLNGFTAPP